MTTKSTPMDHNTTTNGTCEEQENNDDATTTTTRTELRQKQEHWLTVLTPCWCNPNNKKTMIAEQCETTMTDAERHIDPGTPATMEDGDDD